MPIDQDAQDESLGEDTPAPTSGEDSTEETLGDYIRARRTVLDDTPASDDNPLSVWEEESQIFEDIGVLDVEYVPDVDRIVGRDDEIQAFARRLQPALEGGSGRDTLLSGKSGSGKTLVSKYITSELQERAQSNEIEVGRVTLDCTDCPTETQAVIRMAQDLNSSDTDVSIPANGLATGRYYDRLWEIIDELYDSVIVILDEIDRLVPRETWKESRREDADDSKLLEKLSRAGEKGDIDAGLTIIAISNNISYTDRLDSRVDSSFRVRDLVFSAYDANQLQEILRCRTHAFKDGALEEDVIPYVSALAAREHGDARRGIDLLRYAGEVAREKGAEKVTVSHVDSADQSAEISRLQDLLSGTPVQSKTALVSLALMNELTGERWFDSTTMYEIYEVFADIIDLDTVGHRRMIDLLKEFDTMRLVDVQKTSKGYSEGVVNELRLLEDPENILGSISPDSRLEEIPLTEEMKEWVRMKVENS